MYKIIALIGEAGTGKDSLMDAILALRPDFHEIINCTTRPRREGEMHGVNYFYYTPEEFGEKVLHYEMLECTVFNDWFCGTSFESLRSDCINIGVFNPTAIEALLERPDVDLFLVRVRAEDKTRLLRQLNREDCPDVNEIVRRYSADRIDFAEVEDDFDYITAWNGSGTEISTAASEILTQASAWIAQGQKSLNNLS